MKQIILGLMAAIMLIAMPLALTNTSVAYAGDMEVQTQGTLTNAQQAQLQAEAAKMAAQNATGSITHPVTTVQRVQAWVNIGTAIGSGLAASAKQLGIAANQFATTPVGKFTVFLIAWHFIGARMINLLFACVWFIVWVPVLIWYYRVTGFTYTKTEYQLEKGEKGKKRTIERKSRQMTDGQAGMGAVMFIVAVLVFILLVFV